jgi:hypothetical protein
VTDVHPPGRTLSVVVVLISHGKTDADADDTMVTRATGVVVDPPMVSG